VGVKNKIEDKYISYNFAFHILPPLISCEDAQPGKELSFPSPPPPRTMIEVKHFFAALASTVKVMK
jgi:hypothetical protein